MRRLEFVIPVGRQRVTRAANLCVRECVSKYRVLTLEIRSTGVLMPDAVVRYRVAEYFNCMYNLTRAYLVRSS